MYELQPSVILLAFLSLMHFAQTTNGENPGRFQEKTPEFRKIVPENAKIERLAAGFRFSEGPVWNARAEYLLFSDIPANHIKQWSSQGGIKVFRDPSGNSNGLAYDKQGRLIACEHGNRRVSRTEKDGAITVLTNSYRGKRLNSPNDVVVKSDGSIYFTDPPYGIQPAQRELAFQGVYRISPDSKALTLLVNDFERPNGLAFSPDEKVLYIGDSSARKHVRAFDVEPDGALSNGRIFADLKSLAPGAPDGMKVDITGNLYVAGPGGVWIFDKTGKHLGTIVTPEVPANCAWGDSDWKSLYITARTSLYRARLSIPGVQAP